MPRLPHIRLIENWREVLLHAWSSWCIVIVVLLSFAEVFLTMAGWALPLSPFALALITAGVSALALLARILVQKRFSGAAK